MRSIYAIKTNADSVVVEYHEYDEVPDNWKPTPNHLLVPKPEDDPVGHYFQPTKDPIFSKDYAPGFEPEEPEG